MNFLAAVADSPFFDESTRVETLFLATVGRMPENQEVDLFRANSATRRPTGSEDCSGGRVLDAAQQRRVSIESLVSFNRNCLFQRDSQMSALNCRITLDHSEIIFRPN